ncbi:MAG: pseudouridine synthase [Thermodesulfobacteriota bacterium]
MEERLQKIISRAGLASRRGAEKLIREGRVRVNGRVVDHPGGQADPGKDLIEVDGRALPRAEIFHYYLFHKPAGYLTTLEDPRGRPTVAQFFNNLPVRVYPVGRLDMDVEGLLVLTNDGELARRLMHPRFHVPKVYRVKVEGRPTAADLTRLTGGRLLVGDRPAAPARVEIVKTGADRTWLALTLFEGRRRQVKRMCSLIGHPVLKLKRVAYGPLSLGRLAAGRVRELGAEEVKALKAAAGLEP